MVWLTAAALAAGTAVLWWARGRFAPVAQWSGYLGALAYFALFAIGAEAVLETLLHHTVFMTEVHQFLLNPVFLASGAYLGPYVLTTMAERAWRQRERKQA